MTAFIFLVIWVAITLFLGVLGMRSFADSLLLAFAPAALAAAWLHTRRALPQDHLYTAKGQEPLQASYAADNSALDLPGSRLWLRDISGRTVIVDLSDVSGWEHTWTDSSNVWGHHFRINNRMTFRLRQLDHPLITVRFRRYGDTFSGNKNFQEASVAGSPDHAHQWLTGVRLRQGRRCVGRRMTGFFEGYERAQSRGRDRGSARQY